MDLASRKFEEGALTFSRLDAQIRIDPGDVSTSDLRCVVADMEACIPGLSGAELGRAYLIKASCLYYDFVFGSRRKFFDPRLKPPAEALVCARKGLDLLAGHSPEDLSWAESVVKLIERSSG